VDESLVAIPIGAINNQERGPKEQALVGADQDAVWWLIVTFSPRRTLMPAAK